MNDLDYKEVHNTCDYYYSFKEQNCKIWFIIE